MHTLEYEFTDKDISAWGGLRLVKEFMERMELRSMMSNINLPEKGSNRGYESAEIVEGWSVSIQKNQFELAFEHTEESV